MEIVKETAQEMKMEMQTEMPTQTAAVSNDFTDLNIDCGASHEIIYTQLQQANFLLGIVIKLSHEQKS